jgi:hypothetical protein
MRPGEPGEPGVMSEEKAIASGGSAIIYACIAAIKSILSVLLDFLHS